MDVADHSRQKNIRPNAEQTERYRQAKLTMQQALGDPDLQDTEFVTRSVELAAALAESDDATAHALLAEAFPQYSPETTQQPTEP